MDHLGIDKFMVLGYCIGQPFIWNLIKRAPKRVVAAVLTQPSGHRPELPDQFYQNNIANWGPALVARRPDITIEQVSQFLSKMYRANADFVFTVTRDFVRACQIPILVLPDDVPPHPYAVAMEVAMLAPNSQVSMYPWKDVPEKIPLAVRHIRTFLKANRPARRRWSSGRRRTEDASSSPPVGPRLTRAKPGTRPDGPAEAGWRRWRDRPRRCRGRRADRGLGDFRNFRYRIG